MIARRPAAYWAALAAVLLVAVVAARMGLGLLRGVERAPHRVEWALRARVAAGEAQAAVASLEAARRGYRLQPTAARLETLRREHERLHVTFGTLRLAVADDRELLDALSFAERAVGVWTDDLSLLTAADVAAPVAPAHDAPGLELVRDRLGAVIAAANRAHADAQRDVRERHRRAEWLWLAGSGVLLLLLAVYHDLAYRRQQRVVEASRDLDLLLGALPFALLSIDHDLRIRHATGFLHRVLGVKTRELRGVRITDLVSEADGATTEAAVRVALGGAAKGCEVVTRSGAERLRALSIMCSPIREEGHVVGASAVIHDVTTERMLRSQVLQSDRLATVGALVAGVVHEVNNPLTSIIANAGLVDRSTLTLEDRVALDCIAAEAKRAAQVARNLLDFSRRGARPYEPTDLGSVIERAVALRRYDLTKHHVEVELERPARLPSVAGDAQQLLQVVLNLLINAEHAVRDRPEPRIALRVALAGSLIRLTVDDTGPGVPEDRRATVFEPFFTTKPEGEGTGLGLSVSRGIVEAHRGRMWVARSSLGGARFVVELPCAAAPTEAVAGTAPALSHSL